MFSVSRKHFHMVRKCFHSLENISVWLEHFSRPLHSIYKIGLILLFKPILQIHKYIVIHIYLLYIVYFFRYIVISEAIYIIEIYISVSHCHYFSTITSSLFARSARGPKIKRRILGY